ncbi:MAG: inorganic phosphate transporter, partial [Candidatus Poseidoniia archaeon]|nr:inorganic phosphate transporter [Candidatus Poseidoniia archaeon]
MLELMILLAIAVAAYMAWNIGANDVANAMGTSVGSRALTLRNAIIIAAVFEFCGAFFAGDAVTDTVRKGVLVISEEEMARLSRELQYGFIAAMMAAALWITVATRYGLPVSTTHSILGGIVGIGLFLDPPLVDFQKVGHIVLSWVISPLLGGLLAYGTFTVIRMTIMESDDPIQ